MLHKLLKYSLMPFCLLCISAGNTSAQVHKLKEVNIKKTKQNHTTNPDNRLEHFGKGMKTTWIDSQWLAQYQMQNLQQLLSQQIPVFVKSYGINSMATLQFRGASAAQSQVLWNGIPLNSANSGIADISMFGVQQFDQIGIIYGSSGALLGSGNVGASLLLNNTNSQIDSGKKWQHQPAFEWGNFGQYKWGIKEQFQNTNLAITAQLSQQFAANNFSYIDNNGVNKTMSNAKLKANNAMLNLAYQFNSQTSVKMGIWVQQFEREIPAALFEKVSVKKQVDESLRGYISAEHYTKKSAKFYSKTAFIQDKLWYNDAAVALSNRNTCQQIYQEAGWKKSLNRHQELLIFCPVSSSWTRPQNDSIVRYQNKIGIAAAYSIQLLNNRLSASNSIRLEQINNNTVLLGGVNTSFQANHWFQVRANLQNTFRAPTLNELFFVPGGNPNLRPERGWNTDLGYTLNLPFKKYLLIKHDLSLFSRRINDWILWFGGSIWTPHNIALVHSRGIESNNSLHFKQNKWNLYFGFNTLFVLSTTQKSNVPNDGSINKQIPYTPRYNGQGNIGLIFQSWRLNYNHTYTGYRFITSDESEFLEPYQTGNVYLSKEWKIKKINRLIFYTQANNLWNQRYQIVSQRPMPLRNISMGVSAIF